MSPPYTLKRPAPRVAVLSDNRIASSGEATLIAFLRRPNTRSFGQPTCGLSTANATYPLSDSATLTLTTSVMADRAKTPFGDSIPPDEVIRRSQPRPSSAPSTGCRRAARYLPVECGILRAMDVFADFRVAARGLLRSKGFAFAAAITLALGIAATTTIFSVVYGVLLRPLPYRDADRLVVIQGEKDFSTGPTDDELFAGRARGVCRRDTRRSRRSP